jgi:predicted dehydrogenase
MSAETKTWQVGIVGLSPSGLFLSERMSLEPAIHLTGAFDPDPQRTKLVASSSVPIWNQLDNALSSSEIDVLIFCANFTEEDIATALREKKHVVIDRPWQLSSAALRRLNDLACRHQQVAVVASHKRFSTTFTAAYDVRSRLGSLRSARFASCEQTLPTDNSYRGVLREFGYDRLDQLLLLVDSKPIRVFARQFINAKSETDYGILVTIEFANNCVAQIVIELQSRLSHRTGWMLEGSKASFKNDSLFETTSDGEIVDERLPASTNTPVKFMQQLINSWDAVTTTLPTLEEAAETVRLVEIIEQSVAHNQAINI